MTLVYTVEFPKNSEKEISVSYNISGTMDKTVGNLQNSFWYFAPFVIVALILLIRIIIIVIILKRNKNR